MLIDHEIDTDEESEHLLEPGHIVLAHDGHVIKTVLGSSVSVCIWDRELQIGAMNHFIYPKPTVDEANTARYGLVATAHLVRLMLKEGSLIENMVAQVFGGSFPEEAFGRDLGAENIAMAKAVLKRKKVPIISDDTGGTMGRKIVFDVSSGNAVVLKVHRLRRDDWAVEVW